MKQQNIATMTMYIHVEPTLHLAVIIMNKRATHVMWPATGCQPHDTSSAAAFGSANLGTAYGRPMVQMAHSR